MQRSSFRRALTLAAAALALCFGAATVGFAQEEPVAVRSAEHGSTRTFGLVIDNSGSFRLALERAVRISTAFIRSDSTASEGMLITFAEPDKVRLKQELTADRDELIDAVENVYAESGSGAFLDAVKLAADELVNAAPEESSKFLIVFTDGESRGSKQKLDEVIARLKSLGIRAFVVLMGEGKLDTRLADRIAKETGGKRYSPVPADDPGKLAESLHADIGK